MKGSISWKRWISFSAGIVIGTIIMYGIRTAYAHTPCYADDDYYAPPIGSEGGCWQQQVPGADGEIHFIIVCD